MINKSIPILFFLMFVSILVFSQTDTTIFEKGLFLDKRDRSIYSTISFNGKMWMAKNLTYETPDSYCYDDNDDNCQAYGRLYKWDAAQKACPSGWHLASDKEWKELLNINEGELFESTEASNDKSYDMHIKGGSSGFAARHGGKRDGEHEFYYGIGNLGTYWSSTEKGNLAWSYSFGKVERKGYRRAMSKTGAMSCRCVKDLGKKTEEEEWKIAQTNHTIVAYEDYKKQFPNGSHTKEANLQISKIRSKTTSFKRGSYTDIRDGMIYPTISFEGKTWMAKNLTFKTQDTYCYDNNEKKCQEYGRLYTWEAAKKACPSGWHLPSVKEWQKLLKTNGGGFYKYNDEHVGDFNKSYDMHIKGGLSGFTALIGGKREMKGDFNYIGKYGNYWSSTDSVGGLAWFFLFDKANGKIISTHGSRRYAQSCRCVKD